MIDDLPDINIFSVASSEYKSALIVKNDELS